MDSFIDENYAEIAAGLEKLFATPSDADERAKAMFRSLISAFDELSPDQRKVAFIVARHMLSVSDDEIAKLRAACTE